jgi:hypothetical protein
MKWEFEVGPMEKVVHNVHEPTTTTGEHSSDPPPQFLFGRTAPPWIMPIGDSLSAPCTKIGSPQCRLTLAVGPSPLHHRPQSNLTAGAALHHSEIFTPLFWLSWAEPS